MDFTIEPVSTPRELKAFINFPHHLYAGNPYWVPSLRKDERSTLDRSSNPSFAYCDANYWIAWRGGKVVGRIAGIINHRHHEKWKQPFMRFGWFDVIDDRAVSSALLAKVETWAREEGLSAVHGPMGFTNLDHAGMLVEGFEELATQAAGYSYAYYPALMEAAGYRKDVDYVEYEMDVPDELNMRISKLADLVLKRYHLRLVSAADKQELIPYAHQLFDLLGKEYEHLYGVVPLSEEQVEAYIAQYLGFISPEFVPIIIDQDDQMAAFGIVLPSLSKALQRCKGRLFPFGIFHLMRALKVNDRADLMLVAVSGPNRGKGLNAVLIKQMFAIFKEFGIQKVESNPELETNIAVQAQWKHFTRRQHKRRRIYIKDL